MRNSKSEEEGGDFCFLNAISFTKSKKYIENIPNANSKYKKTKTFPDFQKEISKPIP